ncbi:MAG: oxygen-independent coproporphyrinogen III oxidase [Peptostreptococcus stomatis]|uniref:radical SAM family heme chaperone HemW n=1 Tax=Peptostreptococcus stomatis TaxID=341694 RepID=UPI001A526312|nr:radical SAM family heme chaperone HemW [Peptostreptococcus stomatis]MBL6465265.1 oxygen-independent coproporphyrinogen III oxidase [Peptostreptococcus stomatis]
MKTRGLYIHIPFCAKKCGYCDFTSLVGNGTQIDDYLSYLDKEFSLYKAGNLIDDIETIFIGGGTPSILSAGQLERLFSIIGENVDLSKLREYTMESNPGSLTRDKLELMKAGGLNRLSIGLQASQDHLLKFLERIHTYEEFLESYRLARLVGFDNINIDLMFAFQGQTLEDWRETLERVVSLEPDHISAYSLIIEEGTKFFNMYEDGSLTDYDEDEYVQMYRYTIDYLADKGYGQYEISNFAKQDKECRHNLIYWDDREYYGLGLGSSGYLGGKRYTNYKNMFNYYKKLDAGERPIAFEETISNREKLNEYLILGLRKIEGISRTKYLDRLKKIDEDKYKENIEIINSYIGSGHIILEGDHIRLSQTGLEISDTISLDLLLY